MKCKDCNEEGCPYRAYTNDAECLYTPCREIEETSFDWQSFRNQAAKDILCALIPFGKDEGLTKEETLEYCVKNAVFIADKLITKLKEKEEK